MLDFGHSRVKSSVCFSWFSVKVPVVRPQLYDPGLRELGGHV